MARPSRTKASGAAEQATMALDSLFIAYTKNGKLANDTQVRAAINGLFRQLDDPSDFDGSSSLPRR